MQYPLLVCPIHWLGVRERLSLPSSHGFNVQIMPLSYLALFQNMKGRCGTVRTVHTYDFASQTCNMANSRRISDCHTYTVLSVVLFDTLVNRAFAGEGC